MLFLDAHIHNMCFKRVSLLNILFPLLLFVFLHLNVKITLHAFMLCNHEEIIEDLFSYLITNLNSKIFPFFFSPLEYQNPTTI